MAILAFYHVWVLVTVNDGVRMAVIGFFISVNMDVSMEMGMLVGMEQITVPVFVGVPMTAFMGMLQGNGVSN
ncbi:MAG: hypothetical protein J6J51_07245, partial [Clostridia bacterium]|nr:hypothetical protein [Clostridia bacterium]